jgi:hypothetical protein
LLPLTPASPINTKKKILHIQKGAVPQMRLLHNLSIW